MGLCSTVRNALLQACLEFLQEMRSVGDEDNGENKSNTTHHVDTYSVFLKVHNKLKFSFPCHRWWV